MDSQLHQPGLSGSESSQLAGALSNTSFVGTQQKCRHQLVHRDAANAATKNMTQDVHLKIVRNTGSSTNKKQHAVGCEYIHTVVNGRHLTVYHVACVRRELHDHSMAACNRKPPCSTKAFVCTFREIKHDAVISSGNFTNEFCDKGPRQLTKQTSITSQEATEVYMVEVIATSYCVKRQLMSFGYSTCLLRCEAKEVVYSWNSPTCA